MNKPLAFDELREANASRCARWHPGFPSRSDVWSGADWSNAMQGEAGEAGNVVKKLRRVELGLRSSRSAGDGTSEELETKLALEIADTVIYADLLAAYYGIDLGAAVEAKFNVVSIEGGFPERIGAATLDDLAAADIGEARAMSEPTTEAGRRHHAAFGACPGECELGDRVLAIEREAAHNALEELRRVVGVLPVIENEWDSTYGPDEPEELVDRAAVLATIAAAMPEEVQP